MPKVVKLRDGRPAVVPHPQMVKALCATTMAVSLEAVRLLPKPQWWWGQARLQAYNEARREFAEAARLARRVYDLLPEGDS